MSKTGYLRFCLPVAGCLAGCLAASLVGSVAAMTSLAPSAHAAALTSGQRVAEALAPAGQSESFEQVFLSGRKASVSVATQGGKPVSLRVTDGDKRIVCQSGRDGPACNWVPLFTQRYRIEVHNGGQYLANYYLVVD